MISILSTVKVDRTSVPVRLEMVKKDFKRSKETKKHLLK
jgi:hypothetical protein